MRLCTSAPQRSACCTQARLSLPQISFSRSVICILSLDIHFLNQIFLAFKHPTLKSNRPRDHWRNSMSFFKKLTQEFNELKANFSDDKDEKKSNEKKQDQKTETKPDESARGYQSASHGYQQPSYGQPPQQYSEGHRYAPPPPPQSPPLPPGWMVQFDQNSQHWYYVDQTTGRTQWDFPQSPPQQYGATPQHSGYHPPPPPADYHAGPPGQHYAPGPGGYSDNRGHGESGNFYNQYGGAQPGYDASHAKNSQAYYTGEEEKSGKKDKKKKDNSGRNMLLAGAAGLAVGMLILLTPLHSYTIANDHARWCCRCRHCTRLGF